MAAKQKKVIITCAATGSIHTPTMSPHLPLTPSEIAEQSIEAAEAGAAIIHLHARNPEDGSPTPSPDVFMEFLPRIKQSCKSVINITTGGGHGMTLEERLAAHAQALVNEAEGGDERLLHDLSQVSAELAQIRAENSYRTSASQAYAQIAADRLDALDVQPIDGYQSLTDFTERRLVPATRTIETFVNRLRRLSERSGDVIALLNTRIDTRIKAQNLELLRSMESSFNLQLRLQNLVEALSVIAASYYAVALIAYMAKGVVGFGEEGHEVDVAIALIAPVVILTIFLLVSRIRHRFIKETENAAARSDKGRPLNDD